jgi:hypothetical protein
MAAIKEPFMLLKHDPSAYHQRKYPDHCQELYWIESVYSICRDIPCLQRSYAYADLKEEFKEIIRTYSRIGKRIKNNIQNGEYSERFLHIMERNHLIVRGYIKK